MRSASSRTPKALERQFLLVHRLTEWLISAQELPDSGYQVSDSFGRGAVSAPTTALGRKSPLGSSYTNL